jgi:hypothetical protein
MNIGWKENREKKGKMPSKNGANAERFVTHDY